MRQVKALLTVFDPLTETSGQTNCAEQQVQWSLSPMTRAFLYPLANFSSSILLSHYAHTHPPSWIPQTCVTRSTTSTVCFSAQRHRLKFPGAQIISPTSLKTHEMLHRRTAPLPLGLLASELRFFSSVKLPPNGQELAHSIHLHSGHIYLYEWLMSLLQRFIEKRVPREPSHQQGERICAEEAMSSQGKIRSKISGWKSCLRWKIFGM